jgi:hypothetical protein
MVSFPGSDETPHAAVPAGTVGALGGSMESRLIPAVLRPGR